MGASAWRAKSELEVPQPSRRNTSKEGTYGISMSLINIVLLL